MKREKKKTPAGKKRRFGCLGYMLLLVVVLIVFLAANERRKAPKPTPKYELTGEQKEKYQAVLDHPEVYPQDLRDKLVECPEAVEFIYGYPLDKDADALFEKDWKDGEIPHFLQWDKRWGYKPYSGSFLGVTGCGPTALAMVYDGLMEEALMDPYAMGRLAEELGYATPGFGTDDRLFFDAAEHLGLHTYVPGHDEWSWIKTLKKRHPMIINVGPGDFTTFGHYIVVSDWNWKGFKVLDPNSETLSEKRWTFMELYGQTKGVWAFEKKNKGYFEDERSY